MRSSGIELPGMGSSGGQRVGGRRLVRSRHRPHPRQVGIHQPQLRIHLRMTFRRWLPRAERLELRYGRVSGPTTYRIRGGVLGTVVGLGIAGNPLGIASLPVIGRLTGGITAVRLQRVVDASARIVHTRIGRTRVTGIGGRAGMVVSVWGHVGRR